jgi:hypothetical protein
MPNVSFSTYDGIAQVNIKNNQVVPCFTQYGKLASATSQGGGRGCIMGPAVQTYYIYPPYALRKGQEYMLSIYFSSGDRLFHKDAYYQADFSFNQPFNLSWFTFQTGTSGNPWSISNGGKTIRYSLEDSKNCGGENDQVQTGTASAIIISQTGSITMDFSFSGVAELEASGYENIEFYLNQI